jgi:hypothetical protein
MDRRTIRFIKRRFKNVGQAKVLAYAHKRLRHRQSQFTALKDIHTANEHHGMLVSELATRNVNRLISDLHAVSLRC